MGLTTSKLNACLRYCHNFNLGLATKTKAWKGVGRECNLGVTFTLLGMQVNVREWTHTLPSGLSLWALKSLWNPEFSKSDLKAQNSLNWKLLYTIGKPLRCRCLKCVYMIHLSTYDTNYGRKKSRKLKCQFNSQPLKVGNCLELHVSRGCATYFWKAFDEGCNFVLNFISIEGLYKKLWVSKVVGVLISGLLIWESWKEWHLSATLVANHKVL